ncbi:MAG: translation initiation factor IF-2 [Bacteroidales bacterium]|nr:translation initiation factor IF-2 [Bacteroidales bacterium]
MAKTKISTLAKELNVALPTVISFLREKGISIDENPNTRVGDDVAEMLVSKFKPDKDLKHKSDEFSSVRMSARAKSTAKEQPAEPERPSVLTAETTSSVHKPRILGKIELDSKGNPIKKAPEQPAPKAPEAPKPVEKPAEKAAEPVAKPVEAPKPVEKPAEMPKPAEKPAPKAPEAPETPKPAEKPVEEPKPVEKPAAAPTAPEKPVAETAEAPKDAEPEVFAPSAPRPAVSLNIVGKIDLDALNQTTRPKKKSKDERRKGGAAAQGQAGAQGQGDRKKRKRIAGKDKVDIEKAGRQADDRGGRQGGGSQQGGQQGGGRGRQQGGGQQGRPQRRPVTPEVSEEDVSKQVKETLARLTAKDKGLKKGAKWRKEKRETAAERRAESVAAEMEGSKVLKLTEFVTANDLAVMMNVPINQVIATCMNLGVMVSINQRLDAETINIVADEFGYTTEYVSAEVADAIHQDEDSEEDLVPRPPIVTVMGHVDHGKTSLLDYIRKANVIAGEAGGITQHIGSYSVTLPDGRHITFLDTPGHEAFTAMRARGAKVTDLCIIIVAADDNVMPQTVEAINHAAAAGVPIVFAINKIDKPHANPDKIKEELAAMNYLVEEWGGKYQSQDISAKKGIGVEDLMEKVLLEAEMLDLKANPNRNATGTIIESTLDKGRGYVANVLVQNGTLRVGDIVLAGNHFGKIKAMFNERNQRIKEAGPATPALILGLNGAPQAGDTFNVMETEQEAREIASKREQLQREQGLRTQVGLTLEEIARRRAIGNFHELNVIVKGDVDGSIEALSDSLIKLSTEEIQVNVIHKAVGEISESDVTLASADDHTIIVGFQVRPSIAARRAAESKGIQIRLYSVIYQAIEEVKDAMAGMLAPEIKEEITGSAEVLETYRISKVGTIAGAIVREGKIKRSNRVRLIRDGIVRYTGELGSLKRFKDDVREVTSGYDCGLSISGYNDIKVGDIIEGFEEVEVARTSL